MVDKKCIRTRAKSRKSFQTDPAPSTDTEKELTMTAEEDHSIISDTISPESAGEDSPTTIREESMQIVEIIPSSSAEELMGIVDDGNKPIPDKIYTSSMHKTNTIEGFTNEKKNSVTSQITFIASIPEDNTAFWTDAGLSAQDNQQLEILGGNISCSISNMSGPEVAIDVYELYEKDPPSDLEEPLTSTVKRNWDPILTRLRVKYNIRARTVEFILRSKEVLSIQAQHKIELVQILDFKTRKYIPSYLFKVRRYKSSSKIMIGVCNTIEYKIQPDEYFQDEGIELAKLPDLSLRINE